MIVARIAIAGFLAGACSQGERPPSEQAAPVKAGSCQEGNEQACEQDCDRGQDPPCHRLASMWLRQHRNAEVSQLYKRLCEGGRKYFCPSHAFALAIGDGIERDRALSRRLFEETCQYDPSACSEFGNLCMAGTARLAQDLELGSFLLDLACRYHDQQACQELTAYRNATR